MSRDDLAIGSYCGPPVLYRGDYSKWKYRFLDFTDRQDLGDESLQSLEEGPTKIFVPIPTNTTNHLISAQCVP